MPTSTDVDSDGEAPDSPLLEARHRAPPSPPHELSEALFWKTARHIIPLVCASKMHTHTHTHAHIRTPVLISFVVIYSATTHLPQLWLAYVLNIIDRTNLAYAQLQMKTDLGLSARDFGYASGIFFVAYAMMQVPANHAVADPRVGATRVLALSMIAWGISATATSRVNSPAQLYSLRFCLGMSESPFFPGVLFYLTRWFPDATSGRATAMVIATHPSTRNSRCGRGCPRRRPRLC